MADICLHQKPGTDVALINGLIHVMIKEGLYDKKFVEERTENFDIMASVIEDYTPEKVEQTTGVPAEDIIKAARLFASEDKGAIYYAMGITQHSNGTDNVFLGKSCNGYQNVEEKAPESTSTRSKQRAGACDMEHC